MKIMKPLIKESLIILNIAGLHPANQNVWSKVRLAIAIILLLTMEFEVLLEIILHWNGLESVGSLAIFTAFYQICFRAFTLIVNRRIFATVLYMLEHFWTPNRYNNENAGEVEADAQVTYRIARKIMTFIFIIYITVVILFAAVLPILGELPFKIYHFTGSTKSSYYESGLLTCSGTASVTLLLGFDFLYAAIIIHVIYELKIIKQKLRTLPINLEVNHDDEGCLKELATLIDQHNFVLRFIKKLNEIYSIMLLNQFLTSVLSFATILVAITTSSVTISLSQYIVNAVYVCAYTSQLYFFCLGGGFLTTEYESIADAVYECQWWLKTQPKFRKSIVLIIRRAQKMEMLSAGDFFPVNLQSFARVVNMAGSFFSVMLAAYRNRGGD